MYSSIPGTRYRVPLSFSIKSLAVVTALISASPAMSGSLFKLRGDYGIGPNGYPEVNDFFFQADDVDSFSDLLSGDYDFIDQLQIATNSQGDQPFQARAEYIGLNWTVETNTANQDIADYSTVYFSARCGSGSNDVAQLVFDRTDSQEQNLDDLVDYLSGDRSDSSGVPLAVGNDFNLGSCLVSGSPVDPVAGNPNSLMATMAQSDFGLGAMLDPDKGATWAPLGLGLGGGTVDAEGFDSWNVTLPINYIHSFPREYSRPILLIVDAPLRYVKLEDAEIYDGSLGLGLRYPVLENWALTPMLRAGFTGSEDAGTLQAVYSGSVTSNLSFYPMGGPLTLALNNSVGYYQADSIDTGDWDMDYDTDNTIFRNGLACSSRLPWVWLDQPTTWELQFVDTRIDGDDWYYDYYDEVVFSMGTRPLPDRMTWQDLRFGLKYTFASDYDSFQFVMNYRF